VQFVKQVIIIKHTDTVLCRKWAFIKANKRLDYRLYLVLTGQRKTAHFITLIKHNIQYNSKRRRNREEEAF